LHPFAVRLLNSPRATLGGKDELVAAVADILGDQLLAEAVRRRRIDDVDAEVEGTVE